MYLYISTTIKNIAILSDINMLKLSVRIASISQLTLDLLREEGVAIETAQMLMKRKYHAIIE